MSASVWTLLDYRRPGQQLGWDYAVYLEGQWLGDVRRIGTRWEASASDGKTFRCSTKRMAGYELNRWATMRARGEA